MGGIADEQNAVENRKLDTLGQVTEMAINPEILERARDHMTGNPVIDQKILQFHEARLDLKSRSKETPN